MRGRMRGPAQDLDAAVAAQNLKGMAQARAAAADPAAFFNYTSTLLAADVLVLSYIAVVTARAPPKARAS